MSNVYCMQENRLQEENHFMKVPDCTSICEIYQKTEDISLTMWRLH